MQRFTEVARQQIPDVQKTYQGAVDANISAYFSRPKEHYKRNKRGLKKSAPKDHTQKPDSDNIAKFVGDCLSGVAYRDDCQLNPLNISKHWINTEDERVEVVLQYKLE